MRSELAIATPCLGLSFDHHPIHRPVCAHTPYLCPGIQICADFENWQPEDRSGIRQKDNPPVDCDPTRLGFLTRQDLCRLGNREQSLGKLLCSIQALHCTIVGLVCMHLLIQQTLHASCPLLLMSRVQHDLLFSEEQVTRLLASVVLCLFRTRLLFPL